ncbi:DNA polymerase kappa-like [Haliotis cracherodii]|uniref:DNA polymerase kappa-like n=1 Tax=Haliotis cracherodii TaxID=6455 RepID=UPI0039E7E209
METDADELEDEEADDWLDTRWSAPVDPFSVPHGIAACQEAHCHPSSSRPAPSAQQQDTAGVPPVVSGVQGGGQMLTRMLLNDNKAGMDGLDKEKINQIIYQASKGSKYFENEKKKEEQVQQRIEEQRVKQSKITESQLKQGLEEANRLLEELEMSRDLSHTIVHIDMDAYYAAVEMRDDPSLRDQPMAVGGSSMLSTSNYEARKYGVRAAMPGFIAKKLCPHLVLVKPNFDKYTAVSKQVREILADYDPNFSPMSLDEAYLDITEHLKRRANFTDLERSYLVRSCDEVGSAWCGCDLNKTLRDRVVGVSQPKQVDHDGDKQVQGDQSNKHLQGDQSNKHLQGDQSNKHLQGDQSNKHLQGDQSNKHLQGADTEGEDRCLMCGKVLPKYGVEVFGRTVEEAVKEMRCRIQQRTRLTASAGIAPNTMLAKVCSDRNKPNGQFRILPNRQEVMDFIRALPIRKISGIGKVSETMLRSLGVVNCQDLFEKRGLLFHLYSTVAFNHFMHICLAIGATTVERDSERKSISTERTFSELSRPGDLYKKCSELCAALVEDLGQQEVRGKTVSIKIKTVKFEVKTRAHSLPNHTAEYQDIFTAARELLRVEIQAVQPQALRLRLMGVRLSNLLHHSLCETKRQDTITGLFQKMAARSPQKTQTSDSLRHLDSRQMDLPQLPVYFSDVCDDTGDQGSDAQNKDGATIAGTDATNIETKGVSELAAVTGRPKPVKGRSRNTRKKTKPKTHPRSVTLVDLAVTDIGRKTSLAEVNNNTFGDAPSHDSDPQGPWRGKASGQKGKRKRQTDLDIHKGPAEQSGESSGYESARQAEHWPPTGLQPVCVDVVEHDKSSQGGSCDVQSLAGSIRSDPSAGSSCEDIQNLKVFQCPVCQQVVECRNLNYFNDHVDICLFRQISSQEQDHHENVVTATEDDKDDDEDLIDVARSSERHHMSTKRVIQSVPQIETNSNENAKVVDSFESSQQDNSKTTATSGRISTHPGDKSADWQHSTLIDGTGPGGSCEPTDGADPETDQGELNALQYSGADSVAASQIASELQAEFYACPVCNVEKIGCSLEDFNEHVDSCLSRRAIKQILEEQKMHDSPTGKRSSSSSPSIGTSQTPPMKKRRSSCGKMKTIDSFFKP